LCVYRDNGEGSSIIGGDNQEKDIGRDNLENSVFEEVIRSLVLFGEVIMRVVLL
jgi:hypothetical protein